MNSKIKNYLDALFSDIPRSRRAMELKEELPVNMSERYEDYLSEGKTENQAFSLVISSFGDLDEMLEDIIPSDQFREEAHYYLKRNARNTALGVAMYILGAAVLIGFGGLGSYFNMGDVLPIVGLLILLVFAAIATGLIVYSQMSTPLEYKDYNEQAKQEFKNLDSKHSRLLSNLLSIYWISVTFVYLAISFVTGTWGISWIIWILAAVFESIIKTVFEMRYGHD